jgi:hypothetical protein
LLVLHNLITGRGGVVLILANRRAIQFGKTTEPVTLSLSFMNALFNIELNYGSQETFPIVEQGHERNRHLHHVTRSDLQLALILQKVCNTAGVIYEMSGLSNVWDKLNEYFEDPIAISPFYASLEKFDRLGLIQVHRDPEDSVTSIQLNQYVIPETNKIGHYAIGHPFFFSRNFTHLSIAQQKIILSLVLQQGVKPKAGATTFRMFRMTTSDDFQYQSLTSFLHGNTTHIRQWVNKLHVDKIFAGESVFERVVYHKKGRSLDRVDIALNRKLFIVEAAAYHDEIEPRIIHKKKATILEKYLNELGIAEVASCKQGLEFSRIVRLIKNVPSLVIRYAVKKLYEALIMKETSMDISSNFIRKLLTDKNHAKQVAMARETGIYPFIVSGYATEEIEAREHQFFNRLNSYPEDQTESLMKQLYEELIEKYSRPLYKHDSSYLYEHELDALGGSIQFIRYLAGKQKRQPIAYAELERKALYRYQRIIRSLERNQQNASAEIASLIDWMNDALIRLQRVELVPNVPIDFLAENLLPA